MEMNGDELAIAKVLHLSFYTTIVPRFNENTTVGVKAEHNFK